MVRRAAARCRLELVVRDGARFAWGARTYLMGIVNATPDSFSGDGTVEPDAALARARDQLAAGADLLDVGAESTRPGAAPVGAATELRRLIPALERIRDAFPRAVISVDTRKPEVFRAAHRAGADILNTQRGLTPPLLELVAETGVPVVIMHNQATPVYPDGVVDEVLRTLAGAAERAVAAGIRPEAVILDPGIGFAKTPDHNLALLSALDRLVALGFPTLLGTSRKSTLGLLTGRPVRERAFATAATVALAAAAGVDIVRVHDVDAMRDVAAVVDAVARGWRPHRWASPGGSPGETPR